MRLKLKNKMLVVSEHQGRVGERTQEDGKEMEEVNKFKYLGGNRGNGVRIDPWVNVRKEGRVGCLRRRWSSQKGVV